MSEKEKRENMLKEDDWLDIRTCPSYTDVYLKCRLMLNEYVCIGQIDTKNEVRVKSDIDEDTFLRSAIIGWKPINYQCE